MITLILTIIWFMASFKICCICKQVTEENKQLRIENFNLICQRNDFLNESKMWKEMYCELKEKED